MNVLVGNTSRRRRGGTWLLRTTSGSLHLIRFLTSPAFSRKPPCFFSHHLAPLRFLSLSGGAQGRRQGVVLVGDGHQQAHPRLGLHRQGEPDQTPRICSSLLECCLMLKRNPKFQTTYYLDRRLHNQIKSECSGWQPRLCCCVLSHWVPLLCQRVIFLLLLLNNL